MKNTYYTRVRRWLKGKMLTHMRNMITCREFEEFILRYLENELPEKQRSVFEWHLRMCRECRDYLTAYRQSIKITKSVLAAQDGPIPEDVPEDLIKAILDARKN